MIRVANVDSGYGASGPIGSLTNDGIKAGRRVILAEDEVHVVGPVFLLESETVGDRTLIRN
jgi:hypothetical protein